MEQNYYMINLQKILFMAINLHKKGYENLRVIPSLSPNGLSWRCQFLTLKNNQTINLLVSNWLQQMFEINGKEISLNIEELTNLFIKEENDFLQNCIGKNETYVEWFQNAIQNLNPGELPYAFAEYFSGTNFWKTSSGNQINILPGEEKYYLGH